MNQQHLAAVNVVVQITEPLRRDTEDLVDCRVMVRFESRDPQYYHVVIPKDPEKCACKTNGKRVDINQLIPFLQPQVWLHVVGTSMLHYHVVNGQDNLDAIRDRPEDYAMCEVHLVAETVEVVHGGI